MRRFGMSVTCYIKFTDTDSCNISKFGKCYRKSIVADSCNILRIIALFDQKRFGNDYFMSSLYLLRIVVNKSHYTKFLVNLSFWGIDGNFDSIRIVTKERIRNESATWNESGTNHESRTNQERIMNLERIRNTRKNRPDPPLQWKYGTPSSGN
jgi:hypothetical protein